MPWAAFFSPKPYRRVLEEALDYARRAAHEHEAAAEHHGALASMYRNRLARLHARLETEGSQGQLIAERLNPHDRRNEPR